MEVAKEIEIKNVRLGDFVKIKTGKLDANANNPGGDYPFFTCAVEPLRINTFSYDCECVLVAGNGDLNVKYYSGKFDAYQRTYIIESLNPQKLIAKYLFQFLSNYIFQLRNQSIGGVIKYIKMENLTEIKIPLPNINMQQKIAGILEQADAARQKRKQANQLTEQFLQSAFLEMFGDPIANPYNFQITIFSSVYSSERAGTKCGPFGSALKKHEYKESGIPVWIMDNIEGMNFNEEGCLYISKDKYEELRAYRVQTDDIIISRAGTVGKMCVVKTKYKDSIISTNLIKVSLDKDKILPIYFVSLMNYCKGSVGRLKTGEDGAYTFMNTGILDKLEFPLPPLLLQQKFAALVEQVERLRAKQRESERELDNLFQSLLQQYFG